MPQNLISKYRKYKFFVFLVLLTSIVISIFIWINSFNYYDELSKKQFEHRASENIQFLEKRLMRYQHALISTAAFVHSIENLNRDTWHKFIDSLDLDSNYPGFQGIGYSPVIYDENLEEFLNKTKYHNFNSISIYPKGKREVYVPVQLIEPLNTRNKMAIGYDLYSEEKRRNVLDKARDSGEISTSDKLKLVQEISGKIQAGIILYLPIYENKNLKTLKQRREQIIGFVSGVFRMNDFMSNIALKESLLDYEIFATNEENEDNLLFKTFENKEKESKYILKKELKVNDKTWYVKFYSTKDFEDDFSYEKPLFITALSLLGYFVLLIFIFFTLRSKKLLEIKTKQLKETNKQLSLTQNRYKSVVEQSITGIYIFQEERFLFVNQKFCEMFGYTKDEVLNNLRPTDVVNQEDLLKAQKEIQDRYSGNKTFSHYTVRGIKKDGTTIWLEIFGNAIQIDGKPSVSGVVLDITQRVEAQKELENIFNHSNVGLALISSDRTWLQANNKLLKLLDYKKDEIHKLSFKKLVHSDDYKKVSTLVDKLINNEINNCQIECSFIRKDEKSAESILTISSYKQDDTVEYLLVSILDISELKLKEKLLNQQSKLAVMGEMIGSIAHQWKQPLSLISASASGMKVQFEFDNIEKEYSMHSLDSIVDATQYLSKTIDDFKNFFKPRNIKNSFTIDSCVTKSLNLLSTGFKNKDIEIVQNVEEISLYTFENDLIQVFMNILNNAKDALLGISTKRYIFLSIKQLNNGKDIEIIIRDNAGGIKEENIDKVFEAYFTTKDENGTGIGLYMVKDIIAKHLKGNIKVANVKYDYLDSTYEGAEFKVIIPKEV